MKGFTSLILGIFGTLAFSWVGLAFIPNLQIGHLDPQMDEEGADAYPVPRSGMAERGHRVYVANGCFYCHSQQVRADYAASDIDRKWGTRRSAPRDYLFDRPVMLGRTRMGPDLANVGKRAPAEDENAPPNAGPAAGSPPSTSSGASPPTAAPPNAPAPSPAAAASPPGTTKQPASSPAVTPAQPPPSAAPATANPATSPANAALAGASPVMQQAVAPVGGAATSANAAPSDSPPPYSAAWHHHHLYSPRSLNVDSTMPSYKFLYMKQRVGGEPSADAIKLRGSEAPGEGWEIVPSYDARCLVAYLMSLDQSHDLKEAKPPAGPPTPPAPGKAAK
jgi:cytochrome c oxidase cbb3-type subunit 2